MKKLLSLILVAIMLVTAMPIAFAEGNTYKVGDIVQFGSYPQSEVKDEALIAELNALAPEWEDWTSYGYYSGDGINYDSMVQGDWMRYIDVELNGDKYRGVMFTNYRPEITYEEHGYNNQSYHNLKINTVYWFIFEPLNWRILDPSTGFILCEKIIDSKAFSNTIYRGIAEQEDYEFYNDPLCENYANDYETSSIRKWLNDDFYNLAFTENEKTEIDFTKLNNDSYGTLVGYEGYEWLDSEETEDKIFLLSFDELENNDYWLFPENHDGYNDNPDSSDYAICQGSNSIGEWLLRSPGRRSHTCCFAAVDGEWDVWRTCIGTRPALKLKDITKIHKHTYKPEITEPTCVDMGYTNFICECGYSYIGDYTYENGHSFTYYTPIGDANCITEVELIAKCDYCDETDSIIGKGYHKFSDSFTVDEAPTCTTEGIKSRHCLFCSEFAYEALIDKLDHKDDNGDYECDYNCGYEFEKPSPDVPEKELNFFQKIIQWFKDLFDKLFGWIKK
ncbi:MAG: hypothetical protein J6Q79_01095 [Clostridia bacterium]|nr:hypothetical protein [Clostridia bacterium]